MGSNKRFFWLKLKDDFFGQKVIKKLRKIAGGDTYTIIYLKMQLRSLQNEGILIYEGIEDNFIDEIALDIDEDTENVRITVMFLQANGLLVEKENNEFSLPETISCIGSETQSTMRSRKSRERVKELQCNTEATPCNAISEKCNGEIEREIDIEIEKDREKEKDPKERNLSLSKPNHKSKSSFDKPSLEAVTQYIQDRGNHVDPVRFYDFYESKGWFIGKNKMKDWKAAVRTWERRDTGPGKGKDKKSEAIDVVNRLAQEYATEEGG